MKSATVAVSGLLNGPGVPASSVGDDGDFYIDTIDRVLYGPKTAGEWPTGVSLVGPEGPPGPPGNGNGPSSGRQLLTCNLDLYISASGSDDTGDGKSATTPWLNADHAYAWVRDNLDLGAYSVTVHLLGSYSGVAWKFRGPLVGGLGAESFILDGGSAFTKINGIDNGNVFTLDGAQVTAQNLSCCPGVNGFGFEIAPDGVAILNDLQFDTGSAHMFAHACGPRAMVNLTGSIVIAQTGSGAVDIGFAAEDHGLITMNAAFSSAGGPHWNNAFVQADLGGMIDATGFTWSGLGAGCRHKAVSNGIVFTGDTGNPNFFPGTTPGVVNTDGYFN